MSAFLDCALVYDPTTRRADLELGEDGDLLLDETPITPMLISLGTDRRAEPDDELPDGVDALNASTSFVTRRGWSGDALDPLGRRIGWRGWLLNRAKQTEITRRFCEIWVGYGSVGVVIAMGTPDNPRVPTGAEISAIAAHLEGLRPVTAEVYVLPYIPLLVPLSIELRPDTLPNRGAVEAAIDDHFAREAEIGEVMPKSRLSEAISAASGEYAHVLSVPAGDIAPDPRELAEPGAITWVAP